MIHKNSLSSDKNYLSIAYRGRFPVCSSVMYIKYIPSLQTKKHSAICDPDVNICF